MSLKKTLLAFSLCFATASIPAAMAATQSPQEKTQSVSILGYDLSNPIDAQQVVSKIEEAAENVCSIRGQRQTVAEYVQSERCERQAVMKALRSLKSETILQAYEGKTTQ